MRPCSVALLALAFAVAGEAQARPAGGRLMAPAHGACDANHLTAYFGKVIGYKRGKSGTRLRIATDYDTIEKVKVDTQRYLYQGRAFTAQDWARIEIKPGVLRPGTRATAWVCSDGRTPPLVDWNGAAE